MKSTITATGTRRERTLLVSKSIDSTATNLWCPRVLSRSDRPGHPSLCDRMARLASGLFGHVASRKDAKTRLLPSPFPPASQRRDGQGLKLRNGTPVSLWRRHASALRPKVRNKNALTIKRRATALASNASAQAGGVLSPGFLKRQTARAAPLKPLALRRVASPRSLARRQDQRRPSVHCLPPRLRQVKPRLRLMLSLVWHPSVFEEFLFFLFFLGTRMRFSTLAKRHFPLTFPLIEESEEEQQRDCYAGRE